MELRLQAKWHDAVRENWELGTDQSVVRRVATQKSAKVSNSVFDWPVCTGFRPSNSKEISKCTN